MTRMLWFFFLVFTLVAVAGGRLPGQATSARISGNVQNEQKKYLAGVEVTAVNVANNASTKVFTSGGKGSFNFLSLAPGIYQVSFDMPGYRSYVAAGIQLSADQSTTLRITLERLPRAEGAAPVEEAEPGLPVDDAGPLKPWQVEFSGGIFADEPKMLNRVVYNDLETSRTLPRDYFWNNRASGVTISSLEGHPAGMLRTLGGIQPLTARLRFSWKRWLSLAAGVSWSGHQAVSAYSLTHDFFNGNPAANHLPEHFSVISEFPDYRLGVNTLFPHVGAQASQFMGPGIRVAEFLHAGWMFASCSFSSRKIVHDGLLGQVRTHELALEGRGNGPALEGGFKLDVAVWRGLGAFVEVSYLLSRLDPVTGESVGSVTVRDQETLEILSSATETSAGRWWNSGGFFSRPQVRSDGGPETGTPFALDLRGPGVRLGLSFHF